VSDAERLARLTPDQRALFERMRQDKKKAATPAPRSGPAPIAPRAPDEPRVLSFAQERLWLLDRLTPGSALHLIGLHFQLDGPLAAPAIERAFVELLRRHEALRTTFDVVGGLPVPVVHPAPAAVLAVVDLTSLPPAERGVEAARLAADEARRPFDLRRDLPLRASLLRLGERAHALLITAHHIASDGWSTGVLVRELSALYGAFARGQASPLAEPTLRYADFASWQRRRFTGDALHEQLAYWRAQLADAPQLLDLPTDRPRPAIPSHRSGQARFEVPPELRARLAALAGAEGSTLFMALLAAYALLLQRYSGQDTVVVGTPVAGRGRTELEPIVGVFINTLALRVDLAGDPSFTALLGRVRDVVVAGLARQELPFERLVEALSPDRRTGSSPVFQALLVVEAGEPAALALDGVQATPRPVDNGTIDLDLGLWLAEGPRGLTGTLHYRADLFDAATAERLVGGYCALLEAAAADPRRPVSGLEILPPAQREQLVVDWNRTDADYPRDRCIHHLFAEQAARGPDACAVLFEREAHTYRSLAARASRLARRLAAAGVGRGARVAVLVQRSPDMVIALLGVLEAGAAYVPLDPDHPDDRIAFMLADAEVALVITQRALAPRLASASMRTLLIDADDGPLPGEALLAGPRDPARADDLAYVIYTSGSTGRPKGVAITHRAVVNFLTSMAVQPGLTERDTLLAVTTLSFDIAGLELFLPLSVGARIVIADRRTAVDGARLGALIQRAGVTVLQATPATWRLLVDAGFQGGPAFRALSGGDTLPPELAAELLRRAGAVYNLFGPTETTIWSTLHRVTEASAPISIGRPIANTRVYVLDQHLAPVPIGVPGELCIGGDGVSPGYIGRPELTKERFIADPFVVGAKLYRTGDRARWRAEGELEHLGRSDFQVKVRGYRIEPGEIEARFTAHPSIVQAAVIARDDHLAAYLVARVPAANLPSIAELRAHLAVSLPDYMIPAQIVFLDQLPLTANGKLDRSALAALEAPSGVVANGRGAPAFAAPSDALEADLLAVWEDILQVRPISTHDDFFALGGHSLRAARLVDAIEERVGRRLPLATLLQSPTIAQLAALLRSEAWSPSWTSLVPIRTTGSLPPFFCVHAIGGNVLNYRLLEGGLAGDRPFYGLQSRGLDGVTAPHTTVAEMAAAYLEEVKSVQPHGPYRLGGSSSGGAIAYEMAQQLVARGEEVALVVLLDTYYLGPTADLPARKRPFAEAADIHIGNLRLARDYRSRAAYLVARARLNLANHVAGLRRVLGLDPRRAPPAGRDTVMARNAAAVREYAPRPYPGRITMLLSREQPERTFEDLRLGWADLAGSFEIRFIPGSHETMLDESSVAGVAAVLDDCLHRTDP
jgi:amino acid adenylation domain-containing protein